MKLPARGRKARWLALVYGLLLFLWLGPEDYSVWPVTLLGTGLSALTVILWMSGKIGGKEVSGRMLLPGATLMGATIGIGASIATAALMFFKNARHAHIYLDFPPGQMLAMLERAPIWGLAGSLVGLALALLWLALKN
jgi:hypothetical protein